MKEKFKKTVAFILCLVTIFSCFMCIATADEKNAYGYPFFHAVEETKTIYFTKGDVKIMIGVSNPEPVEMLIFSLYRSFMVSFYQMMMIPYITKGYKKIELSCEEYEALRENNYELITHMKPARVESSIPNIGGGI